MIEKINIVKIGSDSINNKNLKKLINDSKKYKKETGEKFIFISSGSVKLGKERVLRIGKNINNFSVSSLASIGQKFLMKKYGDFLGDNELIGEILIDDFANIKHLANTILNSLENNVWLVINHNDSLHSTELNNVGDKSDNDKNTIFISKILHKYFKNKLYVVRVIYLTNTNGLLDEVKNTILGGSINTKEQKNYFRKFAKDTKSNYGTGGMKSKLDCSFEVLEYGVGESIISNANNGLECLWKDGNYTKFFKNNNLKNG